MTAEGPRWLPLESSPEGYTTWSASLGLDTTQWAYQEVFGLDKELLEWVRRPVKVQSDGPQGQPDLGTDAATAGCHSTVPRHGRVRDLSQKA